ncbi:MULTISPECIES: hypothetical protein [unclassified Nocardioides]|uniref:hypothetical protein n=1 Tax=unclassified Nocardioides TaxID=2615069 RepID=UPI0009F02EF2|nr:MULTISPECIES: hypothetical protein [unclassified Nocardioides]GAW47926.1 Glycoprotein [Nocardioides sp. PD653-B2]GAW53771.1 Glycoprotein [Nocardioides sp. PD653]
MRNLLSALEKCLARLIAATPPAPAPAAADRPEIDLVYPDNAAQDRLDGSLRE